MKDIFLSFVEIEGNYYMVSDGLINNVPRPSLLERLEEFERRQRERHIEEMTDDKQKRFKTDYHNSIDQR